jgi:hypothetical protein
MEPLAGWFEMERKYIIPMKQCIVWPVYLRWKHITSPVNLFGIEQCISRPVSNRLKQSSPSGLFEMEIYVTGQSIWD